MSAVQKLCENLGILKNMGTIVLNMLKTMAAFGDLLRWKEDRLLDYMSTMNAE